MAGNWGAIVHRDSRMGSRLLRMTVRLGVRVGRQVLRSLLVPSGVVLPVAVVAACGVRHVGDHLHATRYGTSRATAPRSIGRGSGAPESLVQLLQEGTTDIVSCNMHSVCNAHHDERSLRRQGEAGVRGIESGARRLLDLLDATTTLADDGADQDVRHQQAERIRLGMDTGGLCQRLIVQGPNNQAECLTRKRQSQDAKRNEDTS